MKKDNVFSTKLTEIQRFEFDSKVALVFDDMISRSVPFYDEIHKIILDIIDRSYTDGPIFDLGCSTGSTIKIISEHLRGRSSPQFIAVDNSGPMLEKCREKLKDVQDVVFLHENITNIRIENAGMVIMNYTLQFIDPLEREKLLKSIWSGLRKGGVFILAEKINSTHEEIDQLLTTLYYDFKRRNGYSELEISQKREALENVLRPVTPKQQLRDLKNAGFDKSEMIFRWYKFASYIGIK